MKADKKIKANRIKELLKKRHAKDIFVPECKNGPSYCGGLRLLDAWAMKRSWANPCYTGYEIKISRGDYLSDEKWPEYLDLCNEFYFVCPHGVIKPEEVSMNVGLLVASKTGSKLWTRKKAPFRILENPPNLLLEYILMARAIIVDSIEYNNQGSSAEYWRNWLNDKNAKLDLGTQCSRKLRKSYEEQVYNVTRDSKALKSEIEKYREISDMCNKLGINPRYTWNIEEKLKKQRDNMQNRFPRDVIKECEKLQKQLSKFMKVAKGKAVAE